MEDLLTHIVTTLSYQSKHTSSQKLSLCQKGFRYRDFNALYAKTNVKFAGCFLHFSLLFKKVCIAKSAQGEGSIEEISLKMLAEQKPDFRFKGPVYKIDHHLVMRLRTAEEFSLLKKITFTLCRAVCPGYYRNLQCI